MNSVLSSLTRAHVEAALAQIDREGVPPRRESTKFQLVVARRRYPPKYVISLAVGAATGRELAPHEFSGGDETNDALRSLGFTIVGAGASIASPPRPKPPSAPVRSRPMAPAAPTTRRAVETHAALPVVRVVVDGSPPSSPRAASAMIEEAFARWPTTGRAKFTITPGGFVRGDFPSRWSGGLAWNSSPKDLAALVRVAKPLVEACVTKKVLATARTRTRVLTIGVDLLAQQPEHAELVAVIDCESGEIVRWTGKSYPTGDQEASLVQVVDLDSHLLEIAEERVLVLGCHDLNMFSARARANQNPNGVRRRRCDAMAKATARFRPTVVLQHPHSTDTPNIWRMPWSCLARDYPTVRVYASGIGYFAWSGSPRGSLRDVLDGTRSESGVVDIVVKSR
jgi:hypothetical protein